MSDFRCESQDLSLERFVIDGHIQELKNKVKALLKKRRAG